MYWDIAFKQFHIDLGRGWGGRERDCEREERRQGKEKEGLKFENLPSRIEVLVSKPERKPHSAFKT